MPGLLLAAAAWGAEPPPEAPAWRERADALLEAGNPAGALEAATRAREIDDGPWSRFVWAKALARLDPEAARAALPVLFHDDGDGGRPGDDAGLDQALGWLGVDLGLGDMAARRFAAVPPGTGEFAGAQAGLAVLAARTGDPEAALLHLERSAAARPLSPDLAKLADELRLSHARARFSAALAAGDANEAGLQFERLLELAPGSATALRAEADLALLRGDPRARERALRALLAVSPGDEDAARLWVDSLLAERRPLEALAAARAVAPRRVDGDPRLQAIERRFTPHAEAALLGRERRGGAGRDDLAERGALLAASGSGAGHGRWRLAMDARSLDAGVSPAALPFGAESAPALPSPAQEASGALLWVQWAPRAGLALELGRSAGGFAVHQTCGAVRLELDGAASVLRVGVERVRVEDSLLSFAGTRDPVSGERWGGVVSERAYFAGSRGDASAGLYGSLSAEALVGEGVDDNSAWRAGVGFWRALAAGGDWRLQLGGDVTAFAFRDDRSQFTLGHGGYFSPRSFVSAGPTLSLRRDGGGLSLAVDAGLSWQHLRREASDYFPGRPALQSAQGDPRYPGSSRDGVGARLAASAEWRLAANRVAGLRLEAMTGEDYDEIRLQFYARLWGRDLVAPAARPPWPAAARDFEAGY